jgi:hypothetical protein
MDPEEKMLIQRALKLSEENNRILKRMQRAYRWAIIWGFIKIAIIIVPLVAGYLYFQPLLEQIVERYYDLGAILSL